MDSSETRFGRSGNIASEVIDGEAIIINLDDGNYYSMDGVGAFIWEMLAARPSLREVVECVVTCYEVSPEQARADIDGLVSSLSRENVIAATGLGAAAEPPRGPEPQERLPYTRPELHCYRDMADLLALDPPTPGVLDHLMRGSAEDPRR
jgi:hypothetical protein